MALTSKNDKHRQDALADEMAVLPTTRMDSVSGIFAWETKTQLGHGAFGVVYRAQCVQPPLHLRHRHAATGGGGGFVSGGTYAVKVISKALLDTPEKLLSVAREVDALKMTQQQSSPSHCVHHCVQLYDCFQDEGNIYMVMEMIQGCELLEFVMSRGRIDEGVARLITRQLLDAVAFLHAHRIVHRDLKLENILIDPTTMKIKLIDFGCAKRFREERKATRLLRTLTSRFRHGESSADNDMTITAAGTSLFLGSLIFSGTGGTETYYSSEILCTLMHGVSDLWSGCDEVKKRDVFAIGVITYAMLSGVFPFSFHSREEHVLAISEGPKFPVQCFGSVSIEAQEFCSWLLTATVKDRPQVVECLCHPWLNKLTDLTQNSPSKKENSSAHSQHSSPLPCAFAGLQAIRSILRAVKDKKH